MKLSEYAACVVFTFKFIGGKFMKLFNDVQRVSCVCLLVSTLFFAGAVAGADTGVKVSGLQKLMLFRAI